MNKEYTITLSGAELKLLEVLKSQVSEKIGEIIGEIERWAEILDKTHKLD